MTKSVTEKPKRTNINLKFTLLNHAEHLLLMQFIKKKNYNIIISIEYTQVLFKKGTTAPIVNLLMLTTV